MTLTEWYMAKVEDDPIPEKDHQSLLRFWRLCDASGLTENEMFRHIDAEVQQMIYNDPGLKDNS